MIDISFIITELGVRNPYPNNFLEILTKFTISFYYCEKIFLTQMVVLQIAVIMRVKFFASLRMIVTMPLLQLFNIFEIDIRELKFHGKSYKL